MASYIKESEPINQPELPVAQSVTELDLFPERKSTGLDLERYIDWGDNFVGMSSSIINSLNRLNDKMVGIQERLRHKIVDLVEQADAARSSLSVGKAYLLIHDELQSSGVSEAEISKLFLQCLETNTRSVEGMTKYHDRGSTNVAAIDSGSAIRNGRVRQKEAMKSHAPSWFTGSHQEWVYRYFNYTYFPRLLEPEKFKTIATREGQMFMPSSDIDLGVTQRDAYPDWLDDLENGTLEVEKVQVEIDEDQRELDYTEEQYNQALRQDAISEELYMQRDMKGTRYIQEHKTELLKGANTLPKLLVFLEATSKFTDDEPEIFKEYDLKTEQGRNVFDRRTIIAPEQAAKTVIENFIEQYPYSTELLGLWFEKKIHESAVTPSAKESLDTWFSDIILSDPKDRSELLTRLRGENKRAHDTLKFDILPFSDILDSQEKEYLGNLQQDKGDITYGEFIMEVAELISLRVQREGVGIDTKEFKRKQDEFKRFSRNMLVNHHTELIDLFYDAREYISSRAKFTVADAPENIVVVAPETFLQTQQEGELRKWSAEYSPKYRIDPSETQKIAGATLMELEESLERYMQGEHLNISIKLSSVINAVDGFVGMPDMVRALWPKMVIDGTEFYKIKRGAARIFCWLDNENKRVVFSLYQKESFHYDL